MWVLVDFLSSLQYICKLKCLCNPKLFLFTLMLLKILFVDVVLGISHIMTSARHANIHSDTSDR